MKVKIPLFLGLALFTLLFSCIRNPAETGANSKKDGVAKVNREQINLLLDSLNVAAAEANFNKYFSFFTENATYNGTDATENWNKQTFATWAKPYFDAKTTWDFKALKRNIYFADHDDIAWFEELLSTQMKICRGSGVVIKQNNQWKIQQYVLSMTIPNSQLDKAIAIKTPAEDSLIKAFKK